MCLKQSELRLDLLPRLKTNAGGATHRTDAGRPVVVSPGACADRPSVRTFDPSTGSEAAAPPPSDPPTPPRAPWLSKLKLLLSHFLYEDGPDPAMTGHERGEASAP
jgi:hypothetical protein